MLKFSSFDVINSYKSHSSSMASHHFGSRPNNLQFDTSKHKDGPKSKAQAQQPATKDHKGAIRDSNVDFCAIRFLDESVQVNSQVSNKFSLASSHNIQKTMVINKSPRDQLAKQRGGPLPKLQFTQNTSILKMPEANFEKKRGGFRAVSPSHLSLSELDSKKELTSHEDREVDLDFVKECLVDLYLSVKIRTNHDLNEYDKEKMAEEKANILSENALDLPTLIYYIQTSIQILINMKDEDIFQKYFIRNLCMPCQQK